jgi:DNA invertase Pin-like site-specific DNA recombinase
MARIWGYCRVSLAPPAMPLAEQASRITSYASSQLADHEYVGFTSDDGAGAVPIKFHDRPNAAKLSYSMERGDHLVIAQLHRGFRTLRDFVECLRGWQQRGIEVHVLDLNWITDDAVSALADWEDYVRRESSSAARKAKGVKGGNQIRYGWQWRGRVGNKRLVPCEKERAAIRAILKMRDEGFTFGAIMQYLREARYRFRRGGRYRFWPKGRVQAVVAAMMKEKPDWIDWSSFSGLCSTPEEKPVRLDQIDPPPDRSASGTDHTASGLDQTSDSSHISPLDQRTLPLWGCTPE